MTPTIAARTEIDARSTLSPPTGAPARGGPVASRSFEPPSSFSATLRRLSRAGAGPSEHGRKIERPVAPDSPPSAQELLKPELTDPSGAGDPNAAELGQSGEEDEPGAGIGDDLAPEADAESSSGEAEGGAELPAAEDPIGGSSQGEPGAPAAEPTDGGPPIVGSVLAPLTSVVSQDKAAAAAPSPGDLSMCGASAEQAGDSGSADSDTASAPTRDPAGQHGRLRALGGPVVGDGQPEQVDAGQGVTTAKTGAAPTTNGDEASPLTEAPTLEGSNDSGPASDATGPRSGGSGAVIELISAESEPGGLRRAAPGSDEMRHASTTAHGAKNTPSQIEPTEGEAKTAALPAAGSMIADRARDGAASGSPGEQHPEERRHGDRTAAAAKSAPEEGAHPDRSGGAPVRPMGEVAQKMPSIAQVGASPAPQSPRGGGDEAARSEAAGVLSRGLAAVVQQRGGQMTLRLTPESLGQVKVQMSIEQGSVSVRLEASNDAARGLLNEHLGTLRGSLESRGLSVEKLTVHLVPQGALGGSGTGGGSAGFEGGAGERDGLGQQGARHDAGGAPSRGGGGEQGEDRRGAAGEERPDAGNTLPAERAEPGGFVSTLRLSLHAVA